MLIHAYRRKEPIKVFLFGADIDFTLDTGGAVVADVQDERSVARLLEISEAYIEYGQGEAPQAKASPAADVPPADPLVLKNEAGETLDLRDWSAKKVRAFALETDIALPGGNGTPVAELRMLLANALRGANEE